MPFCALVECYPPENHENEIKIGNWFGNYDEQVMTSLNMELSI